MKKLAILVGGLALSALPCATALADGFSFSGSNFSASGNFTSTPTATAEEFLGTAISGSAIVNGTTVSITGMAPVMGFLGNDNIYFTGAAAAAQNGGRPFDFNGFAFLLSNGDAITLFSQFNADVEILGVYSNGLQLGTENNPITVTPGGGAVTPEPGTLALLGTGALGAFGILRRKLAV